MFEIEIKIQILDLNLKYSSYFREKRKKTDQFLTFRFSKFKFKLVK